VSECGQKGIIDVDRKLGGGWLAKTRRKTARGRRGEALTQGVKKRRKSVIGVLRISPGKEEGGKKLHTSAMPAETLDRARRKLQEAL